MLLPSKLALMELSALHLFRLATAQGNLNVLQYVNPLIGSENGGHVFAGANLPFGMAKAVADSTTDYQGGFATGGGEITGFSHMHDSGTGGSQSLGNFPIFPQTCPDDDLNKCVFPIDDRRIAIYNDSVEATPGYFSLEMVSNITAEMTTSNRTALYRFTFPEQGSNATMSPLILADLIDLPRTRENGSIQVDSETGRIQGNGSFSPSFGIGTYTSHFCADFSGADIRDTGVFMNSRAGTEPKNLSVVDDGINNSPSILPAGAWMRFHAPHENNQILVRVGVSLISVEQACASAEREIPGFDFEGVQDVARKAWADQLSSIQVQSGSGFNDTYLELFWSSIYRLGLSPQDYTGENPLWDSDEPYFDSYYCIWDSFRSTHPLLTIIDPEIQIRMMRSLLDVYRYEGWLPDCHMSLCKGFTQGGSNADILFADLFVKMRDIAEEYGIDWDTAYEAVKNDAENEPENWAVQGRGGLQSWKNLHFIPTEDYDPYGVGPFTRSISRTVEYAYNDFCIAQMASVMGKMEDAQIYSERSTYWRNMYKADQTSRNFTGFLMPKFQNLTWGYQDPIFCSPLLNFTECYLNPDGHETYEGSSWLYTFFVPHDQAALIPTLGGPSTFVRRLDYFQESGLTYQGNEQYFLPIFQYHYAGRPAKTAERIHSYIPSQFNTTTAGIPGNDDSGGMGSFVALTMMGTFPNPGQNVYFITPPFFEEISTTNKLTGNVATIRNVNFDPTYKDIYIQSATLNGEPFTNNWIDHSFYNEGGVLELTLGPRESAWGTRPEDLPPSMSTHHDLTGYSSMF